MHESLDSIKGERMLSYNAALSFLMLYERRYSTVLDLVGIKKGKTDMVFNAVNMQVHVRPVFETGEDGKEKTNSWELSCSDPSDFIETMGFKLLREHSFSYTIIGYIVAQALQALRGCDKLLCLLVAIVLGTWIYQLNNLLTRILFRLQAGFYPGPRLPALNDNQHPAQNKNERPPHA